MLKNALRRIDELGTALLQRPAQKKMKTGGVLFHFYKEQENETLRDLRARCISLFEKVGLDDVAKDVVSAKRKMMDGRMPQSQMTLIEMKTAEAVTALMAKKHLLTPTGAQSQQTRAMLTQIKKLVPSSKDIDVRPSNETSAPPPRPAPVIAIP